MIGCRCATCTSADPRDQRLRPSILRRADGRPGAARGHVARPADAGAALRRPAAWTRVLFTHPHADHLLGLDEIRRYNAPAARRRSRATATRETIAEVRRVFAYAFEPRQQGGGVPQLELRAGDRPVRRGRHRGHAGARPARAAADPRLPRRVVRLPHRLQRDPRRVVAAARRASTLLVLDALRHVPHPTHFTVAQALEVIARVAPGARAAHAHRARPRPRGDLTRPPARRRAGI